jgi:hypothetical protein
VARPPDGKVARGESRTALLAHVAASLHGVPNARYDEFFQRHGVTVGASGALTAASARTHQNPSKGQRGPRPAKGKPRRETRPSNPALREWLLAEEDRLDLDVALVRADDPTNEVCARLEQVVGVRQVLSTVGERGERETMAVLIFDGVRDRRRLQREVRAIAPQALWREVESESFLPARNTWIALMQSAAAEEGFSAPPLQAVGGDAS